MGRAEDVVKVGSGAVLRWSFLHDDGSPSTYIHRTFSRESWHESGLERRLEMCAGVLAWPLLIPTAIAVFTWYNGSWVKKRTHKGIARQMLEQGWLAAARSIPPPWYYIFELYEDDKRSRAAEYLNRFETKRFLYPYLRDHNGGKPVPEQRSTDCLSDKALFAERCALHDLPAVMPFMRIEDGRVVWSQDCDGGLPPIDLFVKQTRGTAGRGAERWDHHAPGRYRGSDGRVLDSAQLLQHLRDSTVGRRRGALVMRRLLNHSSMADLSNGALATVRVLTCRDEHDGFEVTHAALRMAQGPNQVVDNFHAGGIAAPVDLATGVLGPATDGAMGRGPGRGWCHTHPDTDAAIAGRALPCWRETLELACRTHTEAFSDHVLIGWDIAITDEGPLLVEGNKGPDLDIVQRTHREPIGNSRLGELLAFHLQRTVDSCSEAHRREPGAPLPELPQGGRSSG